MKSIKHILLVAVTGLFLIPTISIGGLIKASAIPTSSTVVKDQQISVPVTVDISKLPEKLGSYTAILTWDANVLKYADHQPGSTQGFSSPVVNTDKVSEGKLIFAAANPFGAEGTVNILNVNFEAVGTPGSKSDLNLKFKAMAAAYSFLDLLPFVETEITGVERGVSVSELPKEFSLLQNHPNPFNPTTKITYMLPNAEHVNLSIYNLLGQKIKMLVDEQQDAGSYDTIWDGKDDSGKEMTAGFYIYKLQAGSFSDMKKMLFVK